MRLLLLVLGAVGVCAAGCSSGSKGAEPPAGSGAPERDGGVAGPPSFRPPCDILPIPEGQLQNRATGSSVFGQTIGDDPGWFDPLGDTECGLPRVRVCRRGTENCTESDEAGQFVLNGLPANEDTEISFEKPGHSKVLRLAHTGSAPINLMQTRLTTEGGRQKLLEKVGRSQDPALALMVAVAITPAEGIGGLVLPDGVVTTLEPGGPGPIYSLGSASPGGLSSDELDPELTATREGGWAVFLDIEPGEYALRFERNGRLCTIALPGFGYGANLDGSIRVKTFAGYATMGIAALCQ